MSVLQVLFAWNFEKKNRNEVVPIDRYYISITGILFRRIFRIYVNQKHHYVPGGLENGFYNALSIGCRSFAFFVRNQRSWNSPPMKDEVVQVFRETAQVCLFGMSNLAKVTVEIF